MEQYIPYSVICNPFSRNLETYLYINIYILYMYIFMYIHICILSRTYSTWMQMSDEVWILSKFWCNFVERLNDDMSKRLSDAGFHFDALNDGQHYSSPTVFGENFYMRIKTSRYKTTSIFYQTSFRPFPINDMQTSLPHPPQNCSYFHEGCAQG